MRLITSSMLSPLLLMSIFAGCSAVTDEGKGETDVATDQTDTVADETDATDVIVGETDATDDTDPTDDTDATDPTDVVDTTAPSLAVPGSITTEEDTPVTLTAMVSDDLVLGADLVLSASAADPLLIPVDGISVGPGATAGERSIVLTPAADAFGSTTLTVTLSDGVHDTVVPVAVTISPVNDQPTILAASTVSTAEDMSVALVVTVGDVDNAVDTLDVQASSNTPALIDAAGLVWSGVGASRTLTLTPHTDAFGSAEISLSASDGAVTASAVLTLTVTPVDDAPQVTGPATLDVDVGAQAPVVLTIADIDTPAADIVVSLGADSAGLLSGVTHSGFVGDAHTVSVQAGAQAGNTTLTLEISDGTTVVEHEVAVTVVQTPSATPLDDAFTVPPNDWALGLDVGINDVDVVSWVAETVVTSQGGRAEIAADGTVTYAPPAGFTGEDTFTYGADGVLGGTAYGIVTMTVEGRVIWWVDHDASPGGDGSRPQPFQEVAPVPSVVGAGHAIYVHDHATPYDLAGLRLVLPDGVLLRGWMEGDVPAPVLADSSTGGVDCEGACVIEDVDLDTVGTAIHLHDTTTTVDVSRVTITSVGQGLFAEDNPVLDLTLTDIAFTGDGALVAMELHYLTIEGDHNVLEGSSGGTALALNTGYFVVDLAVVRGLPTLAAKAPVIDIVTGFDGDGVMNIGLLEIERVQPANVRAVYLWAAGLRLNIASTDIHVQGGIGVSVRPMTGDMVFDRFVIEDLEAGSASSEIGLSVGVSGFFGNIVIGDPLATAPSPLARTPSLRLSLRPSSTVVVQGVQVTGELEWGTYALSVSSGITATLRHVEVSTPAVFGVTLSHFRDLLVEDVVIRNTATTGIQLQDIDEAVLRRITTDAAADGCGSLLFRTLTTQRVGSVLLEDSEIVAGGCPGIAQEPDSLSPTELVVRDSDVSGTSAVDMYISALDAADTRSISVDNSTLTASSPVVVKLRPADTLTPVKLTVTDATLTTSSPSASPRAIEVFTSGPAILDLQDSTLDGGIYWSSYLNPLSAVFDGVDLQTEGPSGITLIAGDTICLDAYDVAATLPTGGAVAWDIIGDATGAPHDLEVVGFQTDVPTTLAARSSTSTVGSLRNLAPVLVPSCSTSLPVP